MSNAMAVVLQTLSARLGIVRGLDLAQACREAYPRYISLCLWALCEVAIAACDLAEVLGAAIGLNLLFGLPLLAGVLVTSADTLLLLWLQRVGIRMMEAFVLGLIAVIGGRFFIEILLSKPVFSGVAAGAIPRPPGAPAPYSGVLQSGAERDGGLPQVPQGGGAVGDDHGAGGDYGRRHRRLLLRPTRNVRFADPEPGHPQHATTVCGDPADSLHQRSRAHGILRQQEVDCGGGLGHGGHHFRIEHSTLCAMDVLKRRGPPARLAWS